MRDVVISGSGVFTPPEVVTNEELVEAFNAYADKQNSLHAEAIEAGDMEAIPHSDVDFIFKASGIERRHVMDKTGVLDPDVMHPLLRQRNDDEPGIMAEMAIDASRQAMEQAGIDAGQVDAVICAASNHERAYPAIAIEVQEALGIDGFGFDMNVACSSATFAMQNATDMIRSGSVDCVLMVNPEICSGHLEWRDRDCHFIFGDVCTAVVLQAKDQATSDDQFEILSTKLLTSFSNSQFTGGAMKMAPDADVADGLLDVVRAGKLSRGGLTAAFGKIFKGTHVELDTVWTRQVERVELVDAVRQPVLIDGDLFHLTPLSVEVVPSSLRFIA